MARFVILYLGNDPGIASEVKLTAIRVFKDVLQFDLDRSAEAEMLLEKFRTDLIVADSSIPEKQLVHLQKKFPNIEAFLIGNTNSNLSANGFTIFSRENAKESLKERLKEWKKSRMRATVKVGEALHSFSDYSVLVSEN